MTPVTPIRFTKTPARIANDHLANAWQLANQGDRQQTAARLTAAYRAACAAGQPELAADIERLNPATMVQVQLASEIYDLWNRIEARCILEEHRREQFQRQDAA